MVWSLTVLGLGIVFAVLGLLYLFFLLIGALFSRRPQPSPEPEPVAVAPQQIPFVESESTDESEIVAVIGAVVAAMTGGRGKIKRVLRLAGKKVVPSRWKYHEPMMEWRLKRKGW